jgi:hypothetical protein
METEQPKLDFVMYSLKFTGARGAGRACTRWLVEPAACISMPTRLTGMCLWVIQKSPPTCSADRIHYRSRNSSCSEYAITFTSCRMPCGMSSIYIECMWRILQSVLPVPIKDIHHKYLSQVSTTSIYQKACSPKDPHTVKKIHDKTPKAILTSPEARTLHAGQ